LELVSIQASFAAVVAWQRISDAPAADWLRQLADTTFILPLDTFID
jgi:hypothetical protein